MRSPFVVTISIAAAAAASLAMACGGKALNDGPDGGVITNPPGPGPGPIATCTPETKPGDPCSSGEGGECVNNASGVSLVCVESHWVSQFPEPPTNPPQPQGPCPETAPPEGSACSVFGLQCLFVDGCEGRPTTAPNDSRYTCVSAVWKRTSPSYAVACPAAIPKAGDSCATCAGRYPATCTYPDNTGCPGPFVECDAKTLTWMVGVSSCNPPPPDAGAD